MGNVCGWFTQCICAEEQRVYYAAKHGDYQALRMAIGEARRRQVLIQWMEWQDPCSGRTALAEACAHGHVQAVQLLLEHGANGSTKDHRGNGPLHLAAKYGQAVVVEYLVKAPQVFLFETNLSMATPLDLARETYTKLVDEDGAAARVEQCIEVLEKSCCLFSGWLYERTDNAISMISGLSSLSSWRRRYCLVLKRGLSDIAELALFPVYRDQRRPVVPSQVLLCNLRRGVKRIQDDKWFNRKEHAFALYGHILEKFQCALVAPTKTFDFAALNAQGFTEWIDFFSTQLKNLEENYDSSLTNGSLYCGHANSIRCNEDSRATTAPFSNEVVAVDRENDSDLQLAIQLSLMSVTNEKRARLEDVSVASASAPDWVGNHVAASPCDEWSSNSVELSKTASHAKKRLKSDDQTVASSVSSMSSSSVQGKQGHAPSFSTIGECIICFDGPQLAVCVPCGHNALCMTCAEQIAENTRECPVCMQPIRELIKLYRP